MSDLTPDLPRLGCEDEPEPIGSVLAGLFAEADRRVAEVEARRALISPVPSLFDHACDLAAR